MSNTTASPNRPWITVASLAGIGVPAAKARPPVIAAQPRTRSRATLVRRPAPRRPPIRLSQRPNITTSLQGLRRQDDVRPQPGGPVEQPVHALVEISRR